MALTFDRTRVEQIVVLTCLVLFLVLPWIIPA
jgi:hypothetical protein